MRIFRKKRGEGIDACMSFSRDYGRIMGELDFFDTQTERIAYLDFAINVIGRELEAENTALFVRRGLADREDGTEFEIPYRNEHEVRRNVPLSAYRVISRPWCANRLRDAVSHEFKRGHLRKSNRTTATLYEELGLVVIDNGRHHQTVAKLKGAAFADVLNVIRAEDYEPELDTNGVSWSYYGVDGVKRSLPCGDYRMALLFKLAAKRRELAADAEGVVEHRHDAELTTAELAEDAEEYPELLVEKNDEIYFLRLENRILRAQLERALAGNAPTV